MAELGQLKAVKCFRKDMQEWQDGNHNRSLNFIPLNILQKGYWWVLYRRATDKITLIAEPAIAYMLLHKMMFIDAI